jgi:hypothetical protein
MSRFLLAALLFGAGSPEGLRYVSAAYQLPTELPSTKFSSGQDVVPYFDGWIRNGDGTFDLVFGYFNRNWEEELAIPPGPDNAVEPGGPDRGQPTYFLPRRQGWVFRVRVPGDFGKQVVTWTIKANGKVQKAYGELLPVEEITERIVMTRGNLNPGDGDPNKPPSLTITPIGTVAAGASIALAATVQDDGLPKPRVAVQRAPSAPGDATRIQAQANSSASARPRGLTVTWMQLRGPAKAAFEPAAAIPVTDGSSRVMVRFAAPGAYTLRATAHDGALATRADMIVSVASAPASQPR